MEKPLSKRWLDPDFSNGLPRSSHDSLGQLAVGWIVLALDVVASNLVPPSASEKTSIMPSICVRRLPKYDGMPSHRFTGTRILWVRIKRCLSLTTTCRLQQTNAVRHDIPLAYRWPRSPSFMR
ncbi:hypothetical protein CONLIGDRAFT_416314 [Coniochaeta ligniaria NRRL 30616]|uniref:Uncharacterized protein n=1 Tax=Coniochaeta ligniaria NRRL 30616 TaxID=1408157 RepID=A0A1J7JBM7_9PEZI|nr:hypothetical protein CONLIGDRAFT_416314 [Coniochaeta ligniaria NRRL 30616]